MLPYNRINKHILNALYIFINHRRVTKSHILAINVPAHIDVPMILLQMSLRHARNKIDQSILKIKIHEKGKKKCK